MPGRHVPRQFRAHLCRVQKAERSNDGTARMCRLPSKCSIPILRVEVPGRKYRTSHQSSPTIRWLDVALYDFGGTLPALAGSRIEFTLGDSIHCLCTLRPYLFCGHAYIVAVLEDFPEYDQWKVGTGGC